MGRRRELSLKLLMVLNLVPHGAIGCVDAAKTVCAAPYARAIAEQTRIVARAFR